MTIITKCATGLAVLLLGAGLAAADARPDPMSALAGRPAGSDPLDPMTAIRAKADAVRHPGADGDNVFHRAAQLHADKIRVDVDAEAFTAVQQALKVFCKLRIRRRQRNRRR